MSAFSASEGSLIESVMTSLPRHLSMESLQMFSRFIDACFLPTNVCAIVFIILCLCALPDVSGSDDRPNVIVILSDDQGWGDLSLNGNTNLNTPNIDKLAKNGVTFDRFYVCPVCSPTRAEFLTGRYHPHSNIFSTSAGGERMDLDEVTIADTFKAAGYATGAFGKWHNGMQYPYHPNGRGFDEYYGFCSGHWADYYSPQLEHNGELVKGDGFIVDDFTNKAIDFIHEQNKAGKPFFAYLPYNTPHSPMQVPDRWWEKFEGKELGLRHREPKKEDELHTRAALAMCENIDWNVGRLVNELEKLKIVDNTIIVYFCDNGPNGSRWNGGMKGRKGSTDEGGVRSPLIIHCPGKVAQGFTVKELGAAIDLLPTLADMAGIKTINEKPLDGISLKLLLTGIPEEIWPDRIIYSHWNRKVSARNRRFRFDNKGMLFDIHNDPGQATPVNDRFPDVAKKMEKAVEEWEEEVVSQIDRNEKPFTLGSDDYRLTQIPARDGTPHGSIIRSNKFPNCSYFLNWKSVDDKITWPVEVLSGGEYEVELWYACKAKNVGCVLELGCGKSVVTAKVTEANDPPLIGAEHDRTPRSEGYIKDFKPMKMGTINLTKGTHELTLRATEIPGDEAIEFRLLMFTK